MKFQRLLQLLHALSDCSAYRDKDFIRVSSEALSRYKDYLVQVHNAELQDDSTFFFGKKKLVLV